MRGLLLFMFSAFCLSSAYGQVLWQDNFEAYELGDFLNQGGWEIEAEDESWAQIKEFTDRGNVLQLQSSLDNMSGMFVTHFNNWEDKDANKHIFTANFDFYTGAGGEGLGMVIIGTEDFDIIIELGCMLDENIMYLATNSTEDTLLDDAQPETWYHITLTYNFLTGEVRGKVDDGEVIEVMTDPNQIPDVFDITAIFESSIGMDNIIIEATAEDVLGISDYMDIADLRIYPNPTSDILKIESSKSLIRTAIYDLAGRKIQENSNQSILMLSELSKGAYFVQIHFENGVVKTAKFIKN